MIKRVLFLTGPCGRDIWMWKIFQELKRREDVKAHFIATRQKDVDFLKEQGVPNENVTSIFSFEADKFLDKEYLRKCEEKYKLNIWDFWSLPLARNKKRRKIPQEEVLGYFQNAFRKIEKVIEDFKPEYYLSYGTAGYDAMVFKNVLGKHAVHVMEMTPGFIGGRFSYMRKASNVWDFLGESYEKIKKRGLSTEQEIKVEELITQLRNKNKKPDCVKRYKEPISKKARKYGGYVAQFMRYRQLPPSLRFVFWPIIQKTYDHLGIFEKPVEGEKFALFPLHYMPEASTLIYGKWYVDQAQLIENIAKTLPVSHQLYVKEHPFGYGNRSLDFYKRI